MTDTGNARVVLRPIGSALPLGFLGLFVATLSFSSVQLGWVRGRGVELGGRVESIKKMAPTRPHRSVPQRPGQAPCGRPGSRALRRAS